MTSDVVTPPIGCVLSVQSLEACATSRAFDPLLRSLPYLRRLSIKLVEGNVKQLFTRLSIMSHLEIVRTYVVISPLTALDQKECHQWIIFMLRGKSRSSLRFFEVNCCTDDEMQVCLLELSQPLAHELRFMMQEESLVTAITCGLIHTRDATTGVVYTRRVTTYDDSDDITSQSGFDGEVYHKLPDEDPLQSHFNCSDCDKKLVCRFVKLGVLRRMLLYSKWLACEKGVPIAILILVLGLMWQFLAFLARITVNQFT